MGKSHEIDYQIKGESIQIVEIELDPTRNRNSRSRCNAFYGRWNSVRGKNG